MSHEHDGLMEPVRAESKGVEPLHQPLAESGTFRDALGASASVASSHCHYHVNSIIVMDTSLDKYQSSVYLYNILFLFFETWFCFSYENVTYIVILYEANYYSVDCA